MVKKITYILVLLLVFSCQRNATEKPKKPDNLISKEKMANIIYDMSLINVAKGVNKKLLEENGLNPEAYIYNKYNIDSIQFKESNNYYTYYLKEYDDIYNKAKAKLTKEKAIYNELIETEKKVKDSIKQLKKTKLDSIGNRKKKKKIKKSPLKAVDSSRVLKSQ